MDENTETGQTVKEILLEKETKLYIGVYVALLILATAKVVVADIGLGYSMLLVGLGIIAVLKTGLIAWNFQHLKHEPRSIMYLMLTSLFIVLALTAAASFSVT